MGSMYVNGVSSIAEKRGYGLPGTGRGAGRSAHMTIEWLSLFIGQTIDLYHHALRVVEAYETYDKRNHDPTHDLFMYLSELPEAIQRFMWDTQEP